MWQRCVLRRRPAEAKDTTDTQIALSCKVHCTPMYVLEAALQEALAGSCLPVGSWPCHLNIWNSALPWLPAAPCLLEPTPHAAFPLPTHTVARIHPPCTVTQLDLLVSSVMQGGRGFAVSSPKRARGTGLAVGGCFGHASEAKDAGSETELLDRS